MYRPSSNDRNDNLRFNSLKFSTARNTILVYQEFFLFLSLPSLVNISTSYNKLRNDTASWRHCHGPLD